MNFFNPNRFGFHNMHGNVAEWCKDVWDEDFYSKREAKQKNSVSTGFNLSKEDIYRVHRVSHFDHWAIGVRSAKRMDADPETRNNNIGFHPARNLE